MSIQSEIIRDLEEIIAKSLVKELFFSTEPPVEKFHRYVQADPRIVFLLAGSKSYLIRTETGARTLELAPGQHVYVIPFALLAPGYVTRYRMLGIVYRAETVRLLRLENRSLAGTPPEGPDDYYHTRQPLSLCGKQLLRLLNQPRELSPRTSLELYRALLSETAELLANDTKAAPQSWRKWHEIKSYLQENFTRADLTRSEAAARFAVTPSYVSQLFEKYDDQTFNACVALERVRLAAHLLRTTARPQKEIADLCGFSSPEYFIKVFHKLQGQTPAAFRAAQPRL